MSVAYEQTCEAAQVVAAPVAVVAAPLATQTMKHKDFVDVASPGAMALQSPMQSIVPEVAGLAGRSTLAGPTNLTGTKTTSKVVSVVGMDVKRDGIGYTTSTGVPTAGAVDIGMHVYRSGIPDKLQNGQAIASHGLAVVTGGGTSMTGRIAAAPSTSAVVTRDIHRAATSDITHGVRDSTAAMPVELAARVPGLGV
jgi:hypothetical protein